MRASLLLRVVARGIDLVIVLAVMELLSRAGWIAGFVYILIADSLMDGSSIGKKLTGLRVVREEASAEGVEADVTASHRCTPRESILRNVPFALGMVLWRIVPFIGWILMAGVVVLEFLVLLGSPNGRRIGDELAQTSVVLIEESKED